MHGFERFLGSRGCAGWTGPVEGGQKETCARSKNYPNPWDLAASSGVESRQPKVPWVNESATPGE